MVSATYLPSQDTSRRETTERALAHAARFTGARRQAALEEVVLANMAVARAVAHRYRGKGVDTEELEQLAYLGLISAAERYGVDRDHDFLSFAVPWMTGTIRRHFRDHTWAIRPLRRVQELHQRLSKSSRTALVAPWPRARPQHCSTHSPRGCRSEARPSDARLTSLDESAPGGRPLTDLASTGDSEGLRCVETTAVLGPLLGTLTAREGYVLRRLYVDEWTQAEIGAELGVSQMSVSRIHSRALVVMRAQLRGAA